MKNYNHRFMIAAPGGPPIEIYRAKHTFRWKVWYFITAGMDRKWEKWCESRCPDKWVLGGRPKIAPYNNTEKLRLHLTAEQKAGL